MTVWGMESSRRKLYPDHALLPFPLPPSAFPSKPKAVYPRDAPLVCRCHCTATAQRMSAARIGQHRDCVDQIRGGCQSAAGFARVRGDADYDLHHPQALEPCYVFVEGCAGRLLNVLAIGMSHSPTLCSFSPAPYNRTGRYAIVPK